jgi:hypothetical protein
MDEIVQLVYRIMKVEWRYVAVFAHVLRIS